MRARVASSPIYPSVTIGVPIYNGSVYLHEALASLAAQDYPNLEIFIADNYSSDKSWEIITKFAQNDDRFRIHQQIKNIGAIENFRYVLTNTDATYFMWAAHDDIWSPGFVTKAVEALERNIDAVLVTGVTQLIDSEGHKMELPSSRPQLIDLDGFTFKDRISALADRVGWCLYGLARRHCLLGTTLFNDNVEATFDVILTYELAAKGTFLVLNEFPFFYRIIPKQSNVITEALGIQDQAMEIVFSKMFRMCCHVIRNSTTPSEEKMDATETFLQCCAVHDEWWPCIRAEQGWNEEPLVTRRLELLRDLGNQV